MNQRWRTPLCHDLIAHTLCCGLCVSSYVVLPKDHYSPSLSFQSPPVESIASTVRRDLRDPVICISAPSLRASQVLPAPSVPKVTITKDHHSCGGKYHIGLADQRRNIDSITQSELPELFSQQHLRLGVSARCAALRLRTCRRGRFIPVEARAANQRCLSGSFRIDEAPHVCGVYPRRFRPR
jgi:hypothetical protein